MSSCILNVMAVCFVSVQQLQMREASIPVFLALPEMLMHAGGREGEWG